MKKLFIPAVAAGVLLLFTHCSKSGNSSGDTGNTANSGNNNSNNNHTDSPVVAYKFSLPQLVQQYDGSDVHVAQYMSVKYNMILAAFAPSYNVLGGGKYSVSTSWWLLKNGNSRTLDFSIEAPKANHFPAIPCYDMDATGSFFYTVIDHTLYKCLLNSPSTQVKIAGDIGNASAVKVLSSDEVLLSTDLQNGELVKFKDDGSQQVIATNLGNPGVCDIYKNEYYVVEKNSVGSVKKIAGNGAVTNILSNLNTPFNICFDTSGNFVLQTQWTKDGGTYQVYSLYTPSGKKITDVADNDNTAIITGLNRFIPLYIDAYDNLFFSHNALVSAGGLTYCNPNSSQNGLWKLQLLKQ